MKEFKSDKTPKYIGTIITSILVFGFFFATGKLNWSKDLLISLAVAYTIHRVSLDEALYVITIEGSTLKVNKKRFLLPPKEYSLKFDEITEIVIRMGGKGSSAIWFRLYTRYDKYLFKLCNDLDVINELVDVFKEKKIKIVDKNKLFSQMH